MANWIQLPDGKLINGDAVREVAQSGSSLIFTFQNGNTDRVDYSSASDANTALSALLGLLGIRALSLTSITPNSAASGGGGASAVLRGTGFTIDFSGGSFPTIVIGAQATAKTFVDDGTVYLTFNTAIGAATVDVTYTSLAGQIVKLVNGYTFT